MLAGDDLHRNLTKQSAEQFVNDIKNQTQKPRGG
jgi:hypothetical protein